MRSSDAIPQEWHLPFAVRPTGRSIATLLAACPPCTTAECTLALLLKCLSWTRHVASGVV